MNWKVIISLKYPLLFLIITSSVFVMLGTLSFTSSDMNTWETHFSDWLGKKFQFPGMLGAVSTEFIIDKSYLVFRGKDQSGDYYDERKFLFTGDALVEQ